MSIDDSDKPAKRLTQAAIGRALGLAQSTMTKLKGQGMPVDSVESARAWRSERQNIAARKPEPSRGACGEMIEAFDSARTREKIADADRAEMQAAEMAGRLVDKAAVERAVFESARGLRDGMTNCSRRLAAEVATLTAPAECEEVIAKELRHLLDAFSRQLAQKIAPSPAES